MNLNRELTCIISDARLFSDADRTRFRERTARRPVEVVVAVARRVEAARWKKWKEEHRNFLIG